MRRISLALKAFRANRFLNAFNLLFVGMALLYRIALAAGVRTSEAAPFGAEKTFKNFIVPLPDGVDAGRYTSVVVWCETFSQFITAARYR